MLRSRTRILIVILALACMALPNARSLDAQDVAGNLDERFTQVRVFTLNDTPNPQQTVRTLEQLFAHDAVIKNTDGENKIWVRGPKAVVDQIEKLLEEDRQISRRTGANSTTLKAIQTKIDELSRVTSKLKEQSLQLQLQYQNLTNEMGRNHPKAVGLRKQLTVVTEALFDSRQEMQANQLKRLEHQVQQLQRSIEGRKQAKAKIVKRRVSSLLGERIPLQSQQQTQAVEAPAPPRENIRRSSSTQASRTTAITFSGGDMPATGFRSDSIHQVLDSFMRLHDNRELSDQQRATRSEYFKRHIMRQLELATTTLKTAQSQLEAAAQNCQRVETAVEKGFMSTAELTKCRVKLAEAKAKLAQGHTHVQELRDVITTMQEVQEQATTRDEDVNEMPRLDADGDSEASSNQPADDNSIFDDDEPEGDEGGDVFGDPSDEFGDDSEEFDAPPEDDIFGD